MIECNDELLTADTELPSDADIAAFQPNSNENQDEEEDEEEEPPPRGPSRHKLNHAVDVLQTLFERLDFMSFTSNIKNISRIIDRDRSVEKRQGLLTGYF